jgi:quercetin dioxygenase-like cupin family protein
MKRSVFIRNVASGVAATLLLPSLAVASATKKIKHNHIKIVKNGDGKKLNVLGDRMSVKLTGEDTGGKYALVEQYNDPGVGIPPHVHANEDEVFKLIEGEVEFWLGDKTKVLKAGDMIYCPKGVPHTWKVVGNKKAKVDLGFFPAGMEKMFEELAQLPAGPPDLALVGEICGRYGVEFI